VTWKQNGIKHDSKHNEESASSPTTVGRGIRLTNQYEFRLSKKDST